MVNQAMMQPMIQQTVDKTFSSQDNGFGTQFKEALDQKASQKNEVPKNDSEELKNAETEVAAVTPQIIFMPDMLLSEMVLPKVNEAGIVVAMEAGIVTDATHQPVIENAILQQEQAIETMDVKSGGTEENLEKATSTQPEQLVKKLDPEANLQEAKVETNNKQVITEPVTVTEQAKGSEELLKGTQIAEQAQTEKNATVPTETKIPTDAVPYVREPVQSTARPEMAPTKTVSVDPKNPEEMMKTISDNMVKNIVSGKQEFELQLEPLNLGKLAIKVTYEAGKTAISIICNNAKTLEAMAQNAKEIGVILDTKLGTETAIVIERADVDYLEQHNQQNQNHQQEQEENNSGQQAKSNPKQDAEHMDFLQHLRLGLV